MPNYLARMCATCLQLFAKGCIECSGAIPLSAPGPVDLPAPCAGSRIAQKRQKNAEGLGRRSAFLLGRAADRRGSGQGASQRIKSWLVGNVMQQKNVEQDLRYKKKAGIPALYHRKLK